MNDTLDASSRRMPRRAARAWLAERLGTPISSAWIRRQSLPYLAIGRNASYLEADLETFAQERLSAAPRRGRTPHRPQPKPEPQPSLPPPPELEPGVAAELAAIFAERRKLLEHNLGSNEARLRAIEYSIGAYRRAHPGAGLESAKAAVLAAVAPKGNPP
jgi:hypothetical protein